MRDLTRSLWAKYDGHPGDRDRLFGAVGDALGAATVLYPGSYIDVAASFVFDDVTYVDSFKRAAQFFDDGEGVNQIIGEHRGSHRHTAWRFIAADYTHDLDVPAESVDLLVSLYAGFVSEACTRYLRPGGWLLVNSSHGDAAMASIDDRYRLVGVVNLRSGMYTVSFKGLDSYLIPKAVTNLTVESLHGSGRGIPYTKTPFAYLFEKASEA